MPENVCIPYHRPGHDLTGTASGAVTGKRFVDVAGDRTADGTYLVETATAAGTTIGVAAHDVADGDLVPILAGPGTVLPVTAEAAITAGDEVEVGVDGQARTVAAGVAVGRCMDGALLGADARIRLY